MWKYYAFLSALFAAATAVLAKVGIRNVSGNLATAIRSVVIVLIAWALVLFSGQFKELKQISKNNLLFLGLSGIATGLSWIFYFKALESGDVSKVAPIDKLSVAITIAFAFLFLNEEISLKVIIGAVFIVLGTIIIIW